MHFIKAHALTIEKVAKVGSVISYHLMPKMLALKVAEIKADIASVHAIRRYTHLHLVPRGSEGFRFRLDVTSIPRSFRVTLANPLATHRN